MTSTVELVTTRDGVTELRRHWQADNPWVQLLLIHGVCEHSGRYEQVGELMAESGIDTFSFDLVGHGASGGRRVYLEDWSTFVNQAADHLQPLLGGDTPVVLMGHSLGGLIAATYALSPYQQPDLMVLSSPAFGAQQWQKTLTKILYPIAPKLKLPATWKGRHLSRDPAVGKDYFSDPLVFAQGTPRFARLVYEQMDKVNASLADYNARTLVFHGGDDTLVLPEYSEAIGALLQSDRTVYPGLRHETLNEPEGPDVTRDIITWIRKELEASGS